MVAAGFGISIIPQSLEQLHAEGVAYLQIEGDAPRALVSLAYRRGDRSTVVRNFVALARRTARSQFCPNKSYVATGLIVTACAPRGPAAVQSTWIIRCTDRCIALSHLVEVATGQTVVLCNHLAGPADAGIETGEFHLFRHAGCRVHQARDVVSRQHMAVTRFVRDHTGEQRRRDAVRSGRRDDLQREECR